MLNKRSGTKLGISKFSIGNFNLKFLSFEVLNSIMYFCHINKLPCLIECTSNQVNQFGGYTKITPKKFEFARLYIVCIVISFISVDFGSIPKFFILVKIPK